MIIRNDDLGTVITDNKDAYLRYLRDPAGDNLSDQKTKSAIVRKDGRKLERLIWLNYKGDMHHGPHTRQEKAYIKY